jgi:hypothetical protein
MTASAITIARLHSTILRWVIDQGYAPDVEELSAHLHLPTDTIIQSLSALQTSHGVVLHPDRPAIWVIHPFSTAPTTFFVQAGDRTWWSNCAWCALGAAALLNRDLTIWTLLGAEAEQVAIHLRNGQLVEGDYWVHFPIPMRQAWDNVIYTCSTMLLFRDPSHVDEWCRRHRIPKGDVQPMATVWEFARVWYGNHLSPTWTKWTTEQAHQIFTRFGFTGDIWQLPTTNERF